MALITYNDKVLVEERPEVAEINKITAGNMNELKSGVNSLDTTRLKKAGDIMTGALTLASNMQPDALTGGGLHCQNSNITGANTILFSNGEGSSTRGLQFVRGSKSDSLWVNNGTLNFTVGRDLGTDNTGTNNIVIHSGVVQDILNSSSTVYPLSANQGRVLDGKIAKAISSPNETSLYTETLSKADFDALVSAGTLIPNTIYNITEGSIMAQTSVPVGSGMIWYGEYDKIPNNYMEAVGQELSKNDYPELFNAIAYQYGGSGDNFNLPNMRKDGIGRVPVQLDGGTFNTLGKTGGAEAHTLTQAEIPAHTHKVTTLNKSDSGYYPSNDREDAYYVLNYNNADSWGYTMETKGWSSSLGMCNAGGDQAHNNLQPYFTVFYIIKVRPEAYSEDLRNLDNEVQEINQVLNQNNSNYFKLPNGFIIIYGNATGAVDANPNGSYDCIFHFPDNIIFDNVDDYSVSAIARDFANHKRNVARSNYDLANQRDYVMVNVDASQTVVEFTIVGKLGGE